MIVPTNVQWIQNVSGECQFVWDSVNVQASEGKVHWARGCNCHHRSLKDFQLFFLFLNSYHLVQPQGTFELFQPTGSESSSAKHGSVSSRIPGSVQIQCQPLKIPKINFFNQKTDLLQNQLPALPLSCPFGWIFVAPPSISAHVWLPLFCVPVEGLDGRWCRGLRLLDHHQCLIRSPSAWKLINSILSNLHQCSIAPKWCAEKKGTPSCEWENKWAKILIKFI